MSHCAKNPVLAFPHFSFPHPDFPVSTPSTPIRHLPQPVVTTCLCLKLLLSRISTTNRACWLCSAGALRSDGRGTNFQLYLLPDYWRQKSCNHCASGMLWSSDTLVTWMIFWVYVFNVYFKNTGHKVCCFWGYSSSFQKPSFGCATRSHSKCEKSYFS